MFDANPCPEKAIIITVERELLEKKVQSNPRLNEKLRALLESKEVIYYFEEHLISKVSRFAKDIVSADGKEYFNSLISRDNLWENLKIDVLGNLLQESIQSWTKIGKATEKFPLENIMCSHLSERFVKGVIDAMALYVERVHEEIKEKEYSLMLQNSRTGNISRTTAYRNLSKKKDSLN